jgi:hypothetical protein
MKKIILSVLALGLSMGLMAQKVYNGAEPIQGKLAQSAKTGNILYPETFEDCASIDDPMFYTQDGESLWLGITATNAYMDLAYGQRYVGNYQVTGIAAVMTNLPIEDVEEEMAATVVDMNGNELARVNFTTADLPQSTESFAFDLVEFDFASPVSASDFMAVIEVPALTIIGESIGGNIAIIASTEIDCASGEMSYSYSDLEGTGDYQWVSILEAWGGNVDLDIMIFPKVSGVGLTEAEVNSLSYVYPNPAKDEVLVASSLSMERVEIVNMLGQVVYSADVNGNSVKVNTAEMGAGNYVVKMYTEAGMATKKLVVE